MVDIRDRSTHEALLQRRIVVLDREFDTEFCKEIISKLLFLQQQHREFPIHLLVDSTGGEINGGLAIIDSMDSIAPPVFTYCYGRADGFAAIIVAHGETNYRYAASNAEFTLSDPWSLSDDVASAELSRIKSILVRTVATDTNNSKDKVHLDFSNRTRFNAAEAHAYNLIDHVVEQYPRCKLGI